MKLLTSCELWGFGSDVSCSLCVRVRVRVRVLVHGCACARVCFE
uniref:Uncharacterized protein n=1 Tax=Anguilla anguilla TaxID=7936 RepID=A0A0E9SB20_ANGAN